MASFAIAVYGAPYSSQASYSALKFIEAALAAKHSVIRVFFYHDGIHTASSLSSPPQDEFDLNQAWQKLQKDHELDFVVCIAAALKRGLLDTTESKRYNKSAENIAPEFIISGLGQLLDAAASADRFITFGA